MARGPKGHQKNTLKIILNETKLPFTSVERQLIGNIAKYHRKSSPKNKDYSFTSLTAELKEKVKILAGILRLADGLDFSHQSIVQSLEVHVAFEYVTVVGLVSLSPILEEFAAAKKKDMFEEAFKKKVMVAWKQVQPQQLQTSEQPKTVAQDINPATRENLTVASDEASKTLQTKQS